jgi:hypothetical protein
LPLADSDDNAMAVVVVSTGAMFFGASAGLNKPYRLYLETKQNCESAN